MKNHLVSSVLTLSLGTALLAAEPVQALSFTFTKIADSRSSDYTSLFSRVALNNKGDVAFGATLTDGSQGIFLSDGLRINPIIKTDETYQELGSYFSLNDTGTVAFRSTFADNKVGIFKSNGTTQSAIAVVERESGGVYADVDQPSINNLGTVAYVFSNWPFGGEIRTGNGLPVDKDNSGTGSRFTTFDTPTINDAGQVTYFYTSAFTPPIIISEVPGEPGYAIVGSRPFSNLGYPSLNNQGTVAFTGYNSDLDRGGIFTTNDGVNFTPRVTNRDEADSISALAINDLDELAFLGSSANQQKIYINQGDRTSVVVSQGDRIFDSSIISLNLFREGFNNAGQVAFFATLEDGTSGIFRADPSRSVPEPTSVLGLLAVGVLGASTLMKRKSVGK